LEVSTRLFKEKKIEAILLCPGFSHKDIAEIVGATENKVSVCVARGTTALLTGSPRKR
jgi:hypothetical protein